MQILENFSLKKYNTFGMDVFAKYFSVFKSREELQTLLESFNEKYPTKLILGGGSNILLSKDVNGFVIKNEIPGIELTHEDEKYAWLKAGAGVNWHQFVLSCIHKGLGGTENLSLIPGSVGASPIQNIGAYGVELKDFFYSLEALHIAERKVKTFTLNDCEFGYRESIFKKRYKGLFVILNVTFQLSKYPKFNTSYGAIREELEKMKVSELSLEAISRAVIRIRTSKLPDPAEIGNAGSFFKNPVISYDRLKALLEKDYSTSKMPYYKIDDVNYKIPAGWLIEQCGWKGYRKGDAGCYVKQSLVLVNYGHATGTEILELKKAIVKSVSDRFGITLETEVNII
jgi:UDP-N-acetylmuramate dehydrogenase